MSDSSPYRAFYPEIRTISTEELREKLFEVTLIDIRSRFEFEVVHISQSINIPLSEGQLELKILKLKELWDGLQLVLVSGDQSSAEAFEAARLTRALGMERVQVYDGGVYSWLHSYPRRTVLMGKEPALVEKILPLDKHRKHSVSLDRFYQSADGQDALVIDIRDRYDRLRIPKDLNTKNITLPSFLQAVANRIWSNKKLCIFDADGSRLRWLHLFLQAAGYYDYVFLQGGLESQDRSRTAKTFTSARYSTVMVNTSRLQSYSQKITDPQALFWFNMAIASIGFENISFVSSNEAGNNFGLSAQKTERALKSLASMGVLRYFNHRDNYIFQIDPKLAWKGPMQGKRWREGVRKYYNLQN